MCWKSTLIFSVFRAQYRSGAAAFFPHGGFAVLLFDGSVRSQGTDSFCEGRAPLPLAVNRR